MRRSPASPQPLSSISALRQNYSEVQLMDPTCQPGPVQLFWASNVISILAAGRTADRGIHQCLSRAVCLLVVLTAHNFTDSIILFPRGKVCLRSLNCHMSAVLCCWRQLSAGWGETYREAESPFHLSYKLPPMHWEWIMKSKKLPGKGYAPAKQGSSTLVCVTNNARL